MMAIVRNNLACLISKHNSFVCKSSVFSAHFFSTWRKRQNLIYPKIYDLLFLKHHFAPEVASLVASDLALLNFSPKNADSILSFLKESGCSTTQLEKIVKYKPRILSRSVDDIKLKIKIFQDLGLSPEEIAKMISSNLMILHLRAKSKIIPSLSVVKGLLGSDYDVARLVRRSAWFITVNLENTLLPNIEFLKSFGIRMDRILYVLRNHPRSLLIKPNVMRKSAEKAREMGFHESSNMFVHALRVITCTTQGMWEVKLQSFQEMGFSETDSLTMFKKYPSVFSVSMKKIEKVKQLLLATGKFNISSIVNFPAVFGCSIEKRLEPRLRIIGILESKNLIKWPGLGTMFFPSEDRFFEMFVRPYVNEVGDAFVTKSCVKGNSS